MRGEPPPQPRRRRDRAAHKAYFVTILSFLGLIFIKYHQEPTDDEQESDTCARDVARGFIDGINRQNGDEQEHKHRQGVHEANSLLMKMADDVPAFWAAT